MASSNDITRRMDSEGEGELEKMDMTIDMPQKEEKVVELTPDEQIRVCGELIGDAIKKNGYRILSKSTKEGNDSVYTISVPYFFDIFRKNVVAIKFKNGDRGTTRLVKILDRKIESSMRYSIETAAEKASKRIGHYVGMEFR